MKFHSSVRKLVDKLQSVSMATFRTFGARERLTREIWQIVDVLLTVFQEKTKQQFEIFFQFLLLGFDGNFLKKLRSFGKIFFLFQVKANKLQMKRCQ